MHLPAKVSNFYRPLSSGEMPENMTLAFTKILSISHVRTRCLLFHNQHETIFFTFLRITYQKRREIQLKAPKKIFDHFFWHYKMLNHLSSPSRRPKKFLRDFF